MGHSVREMLCASCCYPVIIGGVIAISLGAVIACMQEIFWTYEGTMMTAKVGPAIVVACAVLTELMLLSCSSSLCNRRRTKLADLSGVNMPIEFTMQLVSRRLNARMSSMLEDVDEEPVQRGPDRAQKRGTACRRACGCVCTLLAGAVLGLLFFLCAVYVARAHGPQHLDDVTPTQIPCGRLQTLRTQRKNRPRFLWIIPNYENVSITVNRSFCDEMMRLQNEEGFTLGMKGVDNGLSADGRQEFQDIADADARAKVARGVEIWRAAFNGSKPLHFSFPGEWATEYTVELLRAPPYRMQVRSLVDGLLNKIYHCDASLCCGRWFCSAWFQDMF